ncbi:MAG: thiolase family protein [Actinobacteria bacterium]|nr:thiolase family protein [Actinomycetota bacterium]
MVIAGIGATAFGKLPNRSSISLNVEAIRLALQDAGIDKSEVDAVFVKSPTSERHFMYGQMVCEALGVKPKIGGAWDQGGAANIALISFAMGSILSGQCRVAVVCYADTPRTGNTQAFSRPRGGDAKYGWYSTAAGYAMIQQRHAHKYGTGPQELGAIAVACRKHGTLNPHAQLRQPLTLDAYLESPFVVEPLRRADCCLVSDGGGALVLMSAETANQLKVSMPIPILGIGQAQTSWDIHLREDLTSTCAAQSAHHAFAMAGLQPRDIDVAQIYDCFTIAVLMTLEDYGFFPKGQGRHFLSDGEIEWGGKLPINTSGGLLSETGMPGLQLIMEGVRQMRGTALLQVPSARHCLISNQGGTMHTHSTLILGQ